MSEEAAGKSWWSTVPGMITAIAALVTAVGGLLTIVAQNGYLDRKGADPSTQHAAAGSGPATDSASSSSERDGTAQPQPGGIATSPAQIVGDLKARGFKGMAVTSADGSVVSLRPDAEMVGSAFPLDSGQEVQFDRLASVDIEQPWDGTVHLTFVNGQQLNAKTGNYSLTGKNDLGQYHAFLSGMRRIEFLR